MSNWRNILIKYAIEEFPLTPDTVRNLTSGFYLSPVKDLYSDDGTLRFKMDQLYEIVSMSPEYIILNSETGPWQVPLDSNSVVILAESFVKVKVDKEDELGFYGTLPHRVLEMLRRQSPQKRSSLIQELFYEGVERENVIQVLILLQQLKYITPVQKQPGYITLTEEGSNLLLKT